MKKKKSIKNLPTKSKHIKSHMTKKGVYVTDYVRNQHYNLEKDKITIDDVLDNKFKKIKNKELTQQDFDNLTHDILNSDQNADDLHKYISELSGDLQGFNYDKNEDINFFQGMDGLFDELIKKDEKKGLKLLYNDKFTFAPEYQKHTNTQQEGSKDILKARVKHFQKLSRGEKVRAAAGIEDTLANIIKPQYLKNDNMKKMYNDEVVKIHDVITDNGNNIHVITPESFLDYKMEKEKVGDKLNENTLNVVETLTNSGIKEVLSSCNNPKRLMEYVNKLGRKLTISESGIINDQYTSSNNQFGHLLRKSIYDILGLKSNKIHINDNNITVYAQRKLSKDKLPDDFVRSVKNMYDFTQKFIKDNPNVLGENLYRGSQHYLGDIDNIDIRNGIMSTSIHEKNAARFAGLGYERNHGEVKYSENSKNKSVKTKYGDNIGIEFNSDLSKHSYINYNRNYNDLRLLQRYNVNDKLKKRTFMILTGDALNQFKKQHSDVKFKGGEGEVMILT